MKTEATLSIVNKDNSVDTILLHQDGHPSNVIFYLLKYLNTYEKIKKLIENYDSFSKHYNKLSDYISDTKNKREWNYMFRNNNKWYVSKGKSTTFELIDDEYSKNYE